TPHPVSGFAAWQRGRRNVDAAWTFQAVLRSLGGTVNTDELAALEDRSELGEATADEVAAARDRAAEALARRPLARPQGGAGGLAAAAGGGPGLAGPNPGQLPPPRRAGAARPDRPRPARRAGQGVRAGRRRRPGRRRGAAARLRLGAAPGGRPQHVAPAHGRR